MFKQILSTKPNATLTNIALLVLRVGLSAVMIPHGYQKLLNFGEYKAKFMDFLGLGAELSLVLAIGAELICSILLALGFLTRFTLLPLVVTMVIATFQAHNGEIFGD
jgi:putative oxidoreductase